MKTFREHIKEFEVLTAVYYHDEYTSRIEETDLLLKELKDKNIGHESQLKALDAAIEKIKFERAQKSQEISDQKSRKFEVQRKTDKIENDLAHLKKDAETYKIEISGLEEAQVGLEKKNEQIGKEVDQVQDEIDNLVSDIEKEKTVSIYRSDTIIQRIETIKSKPIIQNFTINEIYSQQLEKYAKRERTQSSLSFNRTFFWSLLYKKFCFILPK